MTSCRTTTRLLICVPLFGALVAGAVIPASAVTIDWVTVGDPGNAADTTGYGAVSDVFKISKYELTIQQYTDFLNSVAATDPYSLYNTSMATNPNIAGISRSGTSGGYSYSVIGPSGTTPAGASSPGDRPITFVSWWDAARFANWMHNGQGAGSTETGAYTLGGATSGNAPAVNPGATFYIPTENEWYKAAYFSPVANFGSAGYYRIATQTNVDPANNIGSSYSAVNFFRGQFGYSVTQSTSYSFSQNYLTDVGAFTNAASYYGTFDQSGNVYEWNDLTGAAGSSRGVRGGSWANEFFPAESLSSSKRHTTDASTEAQQYGFRLASPVAVPEPSTWMMGLAGVACAGFQMIRRHKRARSHEHEKAADETGQDKLLKRQKTLRLTVDPFRG